MKFIILLCLTFVCTKSLRPRIEQIDNLNGIFIEKGQSVQMVDGYWTFTIFVNLEQLIDMKENLLDEIKVLTDRFTASKYSSLNLRLMTATNILKILEQDSLFINSLIQNETETRIKRETSPLVALYNSALLAAGLAKMNFELRYELKQIKDNLNSVSAYDKKMCKLKDDIELYGLIAVKKFEKTEAKIENVQASFLEILNKTKSVEESINLVDNKTNDIINYSDLEGLVRKIENAVFLLRSDYVDLLNAVLFAKQGLLHPYIYTLDELKHRVEEIEAMKKNEFFPFPINQTTFDDVLKVMRMKLSRKSNHVIFTIKLPYVLRDEYQLYRALSLPSKRRDNYVYMKPSSEFYIINYENQSYYPVSKYALDRCEQLDGKLLCQEPVIFKFVHEDAPCEVKLMLGQKLEKLENCDVRSANKIASVWLPSMNKESMIFFSPLKQKVTLYCYEEYIELTVINSGIIHLTGNCDIQSNNFIYKLAKHKTFHSFKYYKT